MNGVIARCSCGQHHTSWCESAQLLWVLLTCLFHFHIKQRVKSQGQAEGKTARPAYLPRCLLETKTVLTHEAGSPRSIDGSSVSLQGVMGARCLMKWGGWDDEGLYASLMISPFQNIVRYMDRLVETICYLVNKCRTDFFYFLVSELQLCLACRFLMDICGQQMNEIVHRNNIVDSANPFTDNSHLL